MTLWARLFGSGSKQPNASTANGDSSAWLIVGLGNPGPAYALTRHNAGFLAVDAIAEKLGARWKAAPALGAEIAETTWEGRKAVLCKPQTFMNASGESVVKVARKFRIAPGRMVVLVDEVQLDMNHVRVRLGGSAGGHNGLKSLIQHVGEGFVRVRLGVNPPPPRMPLEKYVLQKFSNAEIVQLKKQIELAADAALTVITKGPKEETFHVSPV